LVLNKKLTGWLVGLLVSSVVKVVSCNKMVQTNKTTMKLRIPQDEGIS